MAVAGPIVREVAARAEQVLAWALGAGPERRPVVFDSCGARPPEGRYLYAAADPFALAPADAAPAWLDEVLDRHAMAPSPDIDAPAGLVACLLSYDLTRRFERLPATALCSAYVPDIEAFCYDALLMHDYHQQRTWLVSTGLPERPAGRACRASTRAAEIERELHETAPCLKRRPHTAAPPQSNFTSESYTEAVRVVKEHIRAGDVYQVNLTQRFTASLEDLDAVELFLRLRERNPAPFSFCHVGPHRAVASSSPERFLRVAGDRLECWPIKGTRPRGAGPADAVNRTELLHSEKDRAENLMIVDLIRNDLGRVARYGSVKVESFCELRELATVFHLVSRVSASKRPEVTWASLLEATFPCGSITGAPKIRAMEIIEQIEGVRRGLSMGAVGYVGFDGRGDFAVAIRTIDVLDGLACFNTGGGIVADSDPDTEYQESLWKARALIDALIRPGD